jgi:hypothetical protein
MAPTNFSRLVSRIWANLMRRTCRCARRSPTPARWSPASHSGHGSHLSVILGDQSVFEAVVAGLGLAGRLAEASRSMPSATSQALNAMIARLAKP